MCVHTCTQVNVINFHRKILVERNRLIFNCYKVDLATIFLYLVDTTGESDIQKLGAIISENSQHTDPTNLIVKVPFCFSFMCVCLDASGSKRCRKAGNTLTSTALELLITSRPDSLGVF